MINCRFMMFVQLLKILDQVVNPLGVKELDKSINIFKQCVLYLLFESPGRVQYCQSLSDIAA